MGNKILYKYLNFEGGIKSLTNLTLKYSSPKSVNDPTEFFVSDFYDISELEKPKIIQYFRKKYGYQYTGFTFSEDINSKENIQEELSSFHKILAKNFYFLSLTHLNNSLSMWYHYADKFKGIIIGYDAEAFPHLYDVKYVKEPPKIRHNCVLDDNARTKQLIDILTTKSEAWSYEQEARDILYMNKEDTLYEYYENGIVPIQSKFIKEIYFGTNCSKKDRKRICNICKNKQIECSFSELVLDYSKYVSIKAIQN